MVMLGGLMRHRVNCDESQKASEDVVAIFHSYTPVEWHEILLHHHRLEAKPGGAVLIRPQTHLLI